MMHFLFDSLQGNGTSVMHRFPYTGINFLCYERIKEYLGDGKDHLERLPLSLLVSVSIIR